MRKKKTNDEFIKECNKIHGNLYDYSLVNYINANMKIKIICKIHGIFEQLAASHINGVKCNKCVRNILTQEQFILLAKEKHHYLYNYSLVNYINMREKICIVCKIHGIFNQAARHHLDGRGCPNCAIISIGNNNKISQEAFIEKAIQIHGENYDYSLVKYKLYTIKVVITCKKHGQFLQSPANHIKGHGCPICKKSKGETQILNFLINRDIEFTQEKIFKNCRDIRPLPFDFYLPKYNLCIEYDGEQHFKPVKHWLGDEGLKDRQRKDTIKNQYCLKNNIDIIRIKFNENIENKLLSFNIFN